MMHYRLYILGPDGRFASADDMQCADDREAVALAEAQARDAMFELWSGARLVLARRDGPKGPR